MGLFRTGQLVRETYEVEKLLGEGAFAEVYRVKHRFLGRQAMKVFKAPGLHQSDIDRLLAEALLLSRMRHPNIVQVFDANVADTPDGRLGFFTMELVPGGTLNQFRNLYRTGFVPITESVDVIRQMSAGLSIAHKQSPPVIHRDIKPANVLVGYETGSPRVRLSDFGLARHVNPLSLLATARGTRLFKAPETLREEHSDSCSADIWSVGLCLYLLLTDRLPYGTEDPDGQLQPQTLRREWVPPSYYNVECDSRMDDIAQHALALDPRERYQNAAELLTALNAWLPSSDEDLPICIEPTTKPKFGGLDEDAERMAQEAFRVALDVSRLSEAADLLEQAGTKSPQIRSRYSYHLRLWRKGVVA